MPSPNSVQCVKDSSSLPVGQFWDNKAGAYAYLYGTGATQELYASPAPISGDHSGAYATSRVVKTGSGIFFGFDGQYNGTTAAWVMAFDNTVVPNTGTVPIASAAVSPTGGGVDINFGTNPNKPRNFTTGLVIAISSTGGTFSPVSFGAGVGITVHTDYV